MQSDTHDKNTAVSTTKITTFRCITSIARSTGGYQRLVPIFH